METNTAAGPPTAFGERWAEIPGYNGRYWVSDQGRVFSYAIGRIIGVGINPRGRKHTALRVPNGPWKTVAIHRLVATAFCHKPEGCNVVNHLNGDPSDDRAENLEWTTQRGNILHAIRSGCWGSKKILPLDVQSEIARQRSLPMDIRPSANQLARQYGVCRKTIVRTAKAA